MSLADALSFQLYSARFIEPLEAQFVMLAKLGYRRVEPYAGLLAEPDRLGGLVRSHGMTMPTIHVGMDRLRQDAAGAARTCRSLGVETIFAPAPPPDERDKDEAGWRALGRELAAIGDVVRGEGVRFGWHNHHWEFGRTEDGRTFLDALFEEAPGLLWEVDLAWIVRGGADPLTELARHPGRPVAAHIKDLAPEGECLDEGGWADPGHGVMDWDAIIPALHAAGVTHFVAEHDMPSDVARFARRAREAAAGWT